VHTGTKIEKLEVRNKGVAAEVSQGEAIEADKALISVGRNPCSDDLGLEALGLGLERGFIEIDERLRTNIDNIYAIGDVTGKNLQAHLASRQGVVAAENALGEAGGCVNYDAVPACVYTEPEIGSVGFSEAGAREKGLEVKVGTFPFTALGKAQVLGETAGFVKMVGDGKTGQVLGVHIVGPRATDLIAVGGLALELKVSMESLAETVFAHPTISEAVKEAAEDWLGKAIHLPQRKG
jgi:dihydrolipoamide dehydrogenase